MYNLLLYNGWKMYGPEDISTYNTTVIEDIEDYYEKNTGENSFLIYRKEKMEYTLNQNDFNCYFVYDKDPHDDWAFIVRGKAVIHKPLSEINKLKDIGFDMSLAPPTEPLSIDDIKKYIPGIANIVKDYRPPKIDTGY